MGQGVEWAVHTLLNLDWLGTSDPVPAADLAAGHDLPPAYLNKQLQLLVKAGLLSSVPGPRGGFRLARSSAQISMLDVVDAIEGTEPLFRCTEIRQCGAIGQCADGDFSIPCAVKSSMNRAESAWRESLAGQTLADVRAVADAHSPGVASAVRQGLKRR